MNAKDENDLLVGLFVIGLMSIGLAIFTYIGFPYVRASVAWLLIGSICMTIPFLVSHWLRFRKDWDTWARQ